MRDAYQHHAEGPKNAPLIFLFHGTGGNERQFLPLARDLLPDARHVAPRGDVSEGGAARFFRRRAEGVYDMEDLARATEKMAGFAEAHIAEANPTEVLALGYSNGANILASLIFARPHLINRAVLMHPLIPWTPAPAPVTARILITAGEGDPICPPPATEALEAWFRDQGAAVETHWHPGGHEIAPSEIDAVGRFLSAPADAASGTDPTSARGGEVNEPPRRLP
jgi:phospholipase/carboxylesterase